MLPSIAIVVMTFVLMAGYVVTELLIRIRLKKPMISRRFRARLRWILNLIALLIILCLLVASSIETASSSRIDWIELGVVFVIEVLAFAGLIIYNLPARYDDDLERLAGQAVSYDEFLRARFGKNGDLKDSHLLPAMSYSYKDENDINHIVIMGKDEILYSWSSTADNGKDYSLDQVTLIRKTDYWEVDPIAQPNN